MDLTLNGVHVDSSGFINTTTNTYMCTRPSTLFTSECEVVGTCTLNDELFEYADGEVVGTCINCGRRVRVPRIPGGFVSSALRCMIADAYDPESDISELIGQFASLMLAFRAEKSEMESISELLLLAKDLLERKSGEKLDVAL